MSAGWDWVTQPPPLLRTAVVKTVEVIDIIKAVIEWHDQGLVPLGKVLTTDPRCRLVHGDFFRLASLPDCGFNQSMPAKLAHAILLDIDHSPSHWLNKDNSCFYSEKGLSTLASKLHPGGIFGLWSNEPQDLKFSQLLDAVFGSSKAHSINFNNPYTQKDSSNTVYIAST